MYMYLNFGSCHHCIHLALAFVHDECITLQFCWFSAENHHVKMIWHIPLCFCRWEPIKYIQVVSIVSLCKLTNGFLLVATFLTKHSCIISCSSFYTSNKMKLFGVGVVFWFLSICLSICPSRMQCMLCKAYSSRWILSMIGTNDP